MCQGYKLDSLNWCCLSLPCSGRLLSVWAELTSDLISLGSYKLTAGGGSVQCYKQQFSNLAVPSHFYATAELFERNFNIELQATTGSQDDN